MQPLESSTNHPITQQNTVLRLGREPNPWGGNSFSMPFFQKDYSEDLALLCLFSFSEQPMFLVSRVQT